MNVHEAIAKALEIRGKIKENRYAIDNASHEIDAYNRRDEEQGYDGDEDIIGRLYKKHRELVEKNESLYTELYKVEEENNIEYEGKGVYAYGDDDDEDA